MRLSTALRAACLGWCLAWPAPRAAHADAIGDYPLDDLPRVLPVSAALPCGQPLVSYRGQHVRYKTPVRVYDAFVPRLQAFEAVLVRVAEKHYGRAPAVLVHMGAHNCRRMRRYPTWVSEHALGNGIDVAGFDFAALPRTAAAADGLPGALRRAFSVRLLDHWRGRTKLSALHSSFLRELARELIARPDIFRVLLGPAFPGHRNHFHFDCAPYRLVEIFDP